LLLAVAGAAALAAAPRPARAADPTTADCLAASESSLSMRNDHKLRAARAQLLVCSAASCPGDIRAECIRRVGDINAAMPTIVFEVKDAAGNDLTAVKVIMDSEPIAERLEGIALSIDPGEHAFTFEASGQPSVQQRFVIREGEKDRRQRVVIGAPVEPAVAATPDAAPGTPAVVETSGRTPLGSQRIAAIAAAGAGVVGVALGAVFGLQAISKHHDAAQACPDRQCPDQHGVDLWNDAVSAGNVSTVAFIVGAAGLAGGAILWFTARPAASEAAPATTVGIGPGSLVLRGTW
jgi:hypothetical protein